MDFRIGARVGPFMVSTPLRRGEKPELRHPAPLPQVCDELRADGWKLSSPQHGVVYAEKGWTSLRIEQVRGGVVARKATSNRTVVLWFALGALVMAACWGLTL